MIFILLLLTLMIIAFSIGDVTSYLASIDYLALLYLLIWNMIILLLSGNLSSYLKDSYALLKGEEMLDAAHYKVVNLYLVIATAIYPFVAIAFATIIIASFSSEIASYQAVISSAASNVLLALIFLCFIHLPIRMRITATINKERL